MSTDETTDPASLTSEQKLLIKQAARRLKDEFSGTFNAETIERYMTDSQAKLEARARFPTWLPILIERFTRDRLRALARLEVGSVDKPAVLFLCVHNAGRSQMAAAWLRHLAGDEVEVFSGGTEPGDETNRAAVAAMAEVGIDIAGEYPQPWTDEIARAADVIVSMGCGDACPVYPGKRYEDWEIDDPAGQRVEVVRVIRDDIRQGRAPVARPGSTRPSRPNPQTRRSAPRPTTRRWNRSSRCSRRTCSTPADGPPESTSASPSSPGSNAPTTDADDSPPSAD